MCLAMPAQLVELPAPDQPLALADILGVRRRISLELLADDPPEIGDWVLVHVGFAMSRISPTRAREQLELLRRLGELDLARGELEDVERSGATESPAAEDMELQPDRGRPSQRS